MTLIVIYNKVNFTKINISTQYIKIYNAPEYIKKWIVSLGDKPGLYLAKNHDNSEFYLYSNKAKLITINYTTKNNNEIIINTSQEAYDTETINEIYFKFEVLSGKPRYIDLGNNKILYKDIKIIK